MVKPPFLGSLPVLLLIQMPPLVVLSIPISLADPKSHLLFVPRLKPSIIRKMQIGSGVSFSLLSLFNLPSIVSHFYILERIIKYFKEIGEVNPLKGQGTTIDAKN